MLDIWVSLNYQSHDLAELFFCKKRLFAATPHHTWQSWYYLLLYLESGESAVLVRRKVPCPSEDILSAKTQQDAR